MLLSELNPRVGSLLLSLMKENMRKGRATDPIKLAGYESANAAAVAIREKRNQLWPILHASSSSATLSVRL